MSLSSAKSLGLLLVLVFAGWAFSGCATQHSESAFSATSSQRAIIRWQQGDQAITGEAIFSRDLHGAVQVQWDSDKDQPALQILLTPDGTLTASGALADRSWSGPVDQAPHSLSSWANFLTTYQNAADLAPGFREIHSPAHRIAYEKTSLGLQSLSVANADVLESIAVAFLPNPANPVAPAPDSRRH